jgi:hypothetical protein
MQINWWWAVLALWTGYCLGRMGEIQARINERKRKAKAYGGNTWDY